MSNVISNKWVAAVALSFVAVFGVATVAAAAEIPAGATAIFEDGQTKTWVEPNDNFDVDFRLNLSSGEWLYAVETNVWGDNRPAVCHEVNVAQGPTAVSVSVSDKAPSNTGEYRFKVKAFVADSQNEAEALQDHTECTVEDDATLVYDEDNVINVIPGNSGNSSNEPSTGGGSAPTVTDQKLDTVLDAITALTNTLTTFIQSQTNTGGGAAPHATCPPTGDTNTVQAWLLANGFNAPFNAIGVFAPTGFWGPVTTGAYAAAWNACLNQ